MVKFKCGVIQGRYKEYDLWKTSYAIVEGIYLRLFQNPRAEEGPDALPVAVPPIKCQGIKTKLVPLILQNLERDPNGLWIEPFFGSGVVALNVAPKQALLTDSNPHLIDFYQAIKEGEVTGLVVREFLECEGRKLSAHGKDYYYEVRDRFNAVHSPLDFLFLNRSCFNGVIRFNKSGGFNVPFCHKPERFRQAYITKIVNQVEAFQTVMRQGEWELKCQEYSTTVQQAGAADFIYCDPPYVGRHVDYYDSWDEEEELSLYRALKDSPARFILSTWHSNQHRKNSFLQSVWGEFQVVTKEHFYHVGAREQNRKPMLEALVMN